jgi:drug/metabolite transporter (DMT)-like permease
MNPTKLVAIVLIVLGALGLAYGGFTFTKDTHTAKIGSLNLSVDEKEHVNVPIWAGLGILVVGVLLLGVPRKA